MRRARACAVNGQLMNSVAAWPPCGARSTDRRFTRTGFTVEHTAVESVISLIAVGAKAILGSVFMLMLLTRVRLAAQRGMVKRRLPARTVRTRRS